MGDPCYGDQDVEERGGIVIESAKKEDCSSGLCLFSDDDQEGQCTCSCKAGCMCPDGWTCKDILDDSYCLPEELARGLGDVADP